MRVLRPLADRRLALLWSGLATSALGDQLYIVALTWIAVGVFGTAAGYLSALQALVVLATALLGGAWADRREQRRMMIAADLVRSAVLLVLVAAWAAAGTPPPVLLIVAVLVLAAGQAFFQPALQTVLPGIAEVQLLPAANALFDTTDRIARLLGPGLVGMVAGWLPVMHFFTLDALSFLVSAGAVLRIGRPNPLAARMREPLLASMRRGFAVTRRHKLLGYVLAIAGLVNGAWYAAFFLGVPLLIARHGLAGPGGSGLGAFGIVISCYGCTNLLATLVVGNRELPERPGRLMFSGSLTSGAGIIGLGVAALAPLGGTAMLAALACAAALSAVGGPMKDVPVATLRQIALPRADIAAAMRAYLVMNYAGQLVAMLLAPTIFSRLGVPPVIIACGALIAGLGLLGLALHGGAPVQAGAPVSDELA